MIYQTGTISSSVKLACLELKWEQKKAESFNAMKKQENLTPEERMIIKYKEDFAKMQENSKMQAISSKISSGRELTDEEITYLQRKNPQLLSQYREVVAEKEAYEKKLKSCRSKEDVEKLKVYKMGEFAAEVKQIANNPNIPKSKKIELLGKILGEAEVINEVHNEFVQSEEYASLPEKSVPDNDNEKDSCTAEEQSQTGETEKQNNPANEDGSMEETDADVLKAAAEYIKTNRSAGEGLDVLLNTEKTLSDKSNS